MIWLAVGAGGAFGSLARHGVNVAVSHLLEPRGAVRDGDVNITVRW